MQTKHWAIADATQQFDFGIPVTADATRNCRLARMDVIDMVWCLYQVCRVLFVDA